MLEVVCSRLLKYSTKPNTREPIRMPRGVRLPR
jgi:hypothetical protein